MSATTPVRELDARGQMCPMPVLMLAKFIKTLESGTVVKLLATDAGARKDIPAWSDKTGNTLLETTEDGGVITFLVQKA